MKKSTHDNNGIALISVLVVAIFIAGIIAAISTRTLWDGKHTQSYVQTIRATEAAAAGLEMGSQLLFGPNATLPDLPGNNQSVINTVTTLPNGAQINSVTVSQSLTGFNFILQSDGSSQGINKTAVSGGALGGAVFSGFGYAVLANNINCIMCHATFDTVSRVNNTDSNLYDTFDRIKLASLESLLVRVGSADSHLAGSFYTRGIITDKSGNILTTLAGSSVTSREFDGSGKLVEDGFGDLTLQEFALAGLDPGTGLYNPFESLYTDYPVDPDQQTDGELPTSFPPVIPDSNGNKIVDATEFADLIATKTVGAITGGTAFGVAPGQNYTGANIPNSSNVAGTDLASTGQYSGNVFLVGTPGSPIVIDGPIFVDGDIVIKGPIEGTGQIFASGNMYFIGDTTYNDTGGSFGTNDGTGGVSTENLISYAAGGNIQIGDYLSPKKDSGGNSYDVMSPEALTMATVDTGGPAGSGIGFSFTTSELTLFNKIEYEKNQADSTYQPRYYQLNDNAPVYRFSNPSKEHGSKYDEFVTPITASELAASGAAVISLAPKADSNGNPWLSDLFLKKIWQEDEMSRDPNGQPYQIDGLLYTNNSIFALARSKGKHNSNTFGQLKIRGGIVAADLGILSAGAKTKDGLTSAQIALLGLADSGKNTIGFNMQYDDRVDGILNIQTGGNSQYTRRVRLFITI